MVTWPRKNIERKSVNIGAGGSVPPRLLLAAAGVGNIGLVDSDVVDLSIAASDYPFHQRCRS